MLCLCNYLTSHANITLCIVPLTPLKCRQCSEGSATSLDWFLRIIERKRPSF